jgi:serine/threonine protein kinase
MNDANDRTKSNAKTWTENWTLVQQLNSGAQGAAMKVTNETVDLAFLKVLKEQGQGDSERRARMYREVAALRTINVLEIPRLIETNADHHEDPLYHLYLVTEFIEGPNLQKAVETNRISAALAVDFAISLAKTLSIAHNYGVAITAEPLDL